MHLVLCILSRSLDLGTDEKLFDITLPSSIFNPFAQIWVALFRFSLGFCVISEMPLNLFSSFYSFIGSSMQKLKYDR